MKDVFGRVERVLVLGGTSAIGEAIAAGLVARRGARDVVLAVRDPDRATAARERLEGAGATVTIESFDLLDRDGHGPLLERVAAEGAIDVVVLAAGVLGDQATAEEDPAALTRVLEVNLVGAASACFAAADVLRRQGTGTLVVLSSVAAVQARRANFVYGASKAGLDHVARGLSDVLDGTGASVLVVRPGFVRTAMTDGMQEAPFAQDADEVAARVVEAIGGRRTVVWSSGPVGVLGTLLRLLPRPVLRRLPR